MSSVSLSMLKRRIKSIESTMKITKAMSMVANSKYARCKSKLYKNNKYIEKIVEDINPFFTTDKMENYKKNMVSGKKLVLVYTSDSGLCGSFNSSIAKKIMEEDIEDTKFIVCGSKGRDFIHSIGGDTVAEYVDIPYFPTLKESRAISNKILGYIEEENCEVYAVYYRFVSSLNRELVEEKVFPIEFTGEETDVSEQDVDLEDVLSLYMNSIVMNHILESKVSELSFRIETTNNAIKNGKDILKDLKKMYNRIRQSNITNEISEIVGGVEAMNRG